MSLQCRVARAAALGVVLLLTACTTVEVNPVTVTPPPQTYKRVVLGSVTGKTLRAEAVVPYFREGFIGRLRELNGFETVTDGANVPAPAAATDTLVVDVMLTEVDKGQDALRYFVGLGLGRERVAATITGKHSDGAAVVTFEARKAYSGGVGIGGATFIDVYDLTKQVGEQAAQSLVDWTQGKLTNTSQ